jgi:hypothetical protein
MKRLGFAIIGLIVLLSCEIKPQFKYKIEGFVVVKGDTLPAIWYTDNYIMYDDSIVYYNSDSSMVSIKHPYTLYEIK